VCVALPGLVVAVGERTGASTPATVRFGDVQRDVDLALVPTAGEGDYVTVHAGFAIAIVPAESARRTLDLLGFAEGA
jgi:hydrogenase expression/formation protein HypC